MYHLFDFHDSSSARTHCSCLFLYHAFNFFWKCTFTRITCTEQELSFTIIVSSPIYLNTSFVTITFCCLFFFTEGLARPVNNKPPKNQCRNSSDAEERNSSKTCRGENVLHLVATNYKTKLQINITYVRKCFHKFYYLDYPLLLLL